MAIPLYVLLPEGVEWTEVPGTDSQLTRPVRWYLRQAMLDAATQTGVLVSGSDAEIAQRTAAVVARATELGGVVVDAATQEPVAPAPTGDSVTR